MQIDCIRIRTQRTRRFNRGGLSRAINGRRREWLSSLRIGEGVQTAVLSHGNHTGVSRDSLMEKALFAVDELSGFVTAVALVRPSKSLTDTDARAVRRKMKDKAFARNVSRDDLVQGAADLGVELDELIEFVADALKPVAGQLGLSAGE